MTDGGNPLFTTKARSIQTDGELKWGGDDGERWEDAIEDSTHVRVGADGEITTSSRPESGVSRWTCNDTDTETGTAIDVWGNSGTGIVYVDGEALPDDKNNFSYGYGSAFPETFGLGKRLGDYLFTRRESRRLRRA
jgi:hypothetical protein